MARDLENLPPKSAAKKNGAAFTIRQTKLCALMGVSEDELRRRRDYFLHQGQHWDYVKKRVQYSPVGAQVLLGTRDASLPEEDEKNAGTTDSGAGRRPVALLCQKNPRPVEFTGRLVAWSAPNHNPHVLVCYLPGTNPENPMNLVTLRVRDNRNFMRGMKIPGDKPPGDKVLVTAVQERDDVFNLQGPLPRWKGRW